MQRQQHILLICCMPDQQRLVSVYSLCSCSLQAVDVYALQLSPGCCGNACDVVLQVQPVIDAVVGKTRSEMLQLLSEGYSLLSPAKATSLLGVGEAEVAHLVEAAGWKQDMESGMYTTAVQQAADVDLDGYENLKQLTQYMVHLES